MKINLRQSTSPAPDRPPARRSGGRFLWLVFIVWAVLFVFIRVAFKVGGNPALLFMIMFALFFVALFMVRYGLLSYYRWWAAMRPRLVRLLAAFLPGRK